MPSLSGNKGTVLTGFINGDHVYLDQSRVLVTKFGDTKVVKSSGVRNISKPINSQGIDNDATNQLLYEGGEYRDHIGPFQLLQRNFRYKLNSKFKTTYKLNFIPHMDREVFLNRQGVYSKLQRRIALKTYRDNHIFQFEKLFFEANAELKYLEAASVSRSVPYATVAETPEIAQHNIFQYVVLSDLQYSSQQLLMLDEEGYTRVHAMLFSNFTIKQVSHLQQNYGKLLTTQDRNGDTLLHVAVRLGRKELVSLLVSHSPDLLLIANHHSQTPLDVAVDERNSGIVTVLFEELIRAGIISIHIDVTYEAAEVEGIPVQTIRFEKLHMKVIAPEWGSAHLQHTCLQAIKMMEGWLARLARQTFTTFRKNPATYKSWNSTHQYPAYASLTDSLTSSSSTLSSLEPEFSTEDHSCNAVPSYQKSIPTFTNTNIVGSGFELKSHTSEQDSDTPASRPTTSKHKRTRKRGTKLSYRMTAKVDETTTLKPVGVLYDEEGWFSCKLDIHLERSGYSPSGESESDDTHLTKPLKRRKGQSARKRNRERAQNRYKTMYM